MQRNDRSFPLRKQDVLAAISVAIYVALIVGLVQAWTYLSDTANAFVSAH